MKFCSRCCEVKACKQDRIFLNVLLMVYCCPKRFSITYLVKESKDLNFKRNDKLILNFLVTNKILIYGNWKVGYLSYLTEHMHSFLYKKNYRYLLIEPNQHLHIGKTWYFSVCSGFHVLSVSDIWCFGQAFCLPHFKIHLLVWNHQVLVNISAYLKRVQEPEKSQYHPATWVSQSDL